MMLRARKKKFVATDPRFDACFPDELQAQKIFAEEWQQAALCDSFIRVAYQCAKQEDATPLLDCLFGNPLHA